MPHIVYILAMAGVTYLIRMLPFTLIKKKIKSRLFHSFLYYLPYCVLAAMTFPAIFTSTGSLAGSLAGTLAAIIMAAMNWPLIVVALGASGVAFVLPLVL